MATYNPASFPRRPKQSNIFTETKYQLQLAYYRYEINTAMYVMSPGEKVAYNMTVLSLLVMLFTAVYWYLPHTTIVGVQRLAYYITGSYHHHLPAGVAPSMPHVGQGVLQHTSEAIASLADKGASAVNASRSFTP